LVCDCREVQGFEVKSVQLDELSEQILGRAPCSTYPGIAYSVINKGLICFIAHARRFLHSFALLFCIFDKLV
jgi:hypothetical protein